MLLNFQSDKEIIIDTNVIVISVIVINTKNNNMLI